MVNHFLLAAFHMLWHKNFILDGDTALRCRCAMHWCDLDLAFDLATVTLTCIILTRLYLRDCKI